MKSRLSERAGGVPIIVQSQALVAAVKALGVRRIALIHPPWFSAELDQLGAEYFTVNDLEVVYHGSAKLRTDYGDIEPKQVFDWVKEHVPDTADIAVIGGSGFRAIGAIEALESEISRPVVSGNQASFWYAMRKSGLDDKLEQYGKLFQYAV
jgi:maleate isomerase